MSIKIDFEICWVGNLKRKIDYFDKITFEY